MSIPIKLLTSVVFFLLVTTTVVLISSNRNTTDFLMTDALAEQIQPVTLNLDNRSTTSSSQGNPTRIFEFTMDDIDGKPTPLSRFKGQVMMIVNTASFCGNTPQYEGLQTLYERYRDQGFTILAFPANDFGKQEPGNNKEIAEFCYTKYSLEFPLFSKITVLGDTKHPLYRYLTEQTSFTGEISWNFQKFLINRKGEVIARYLPKTKPLTPKIVADIENALKQIS
ncbi:MAG: hypothetical protein NPIRA02_39370 [Nitrospirales bacterium]|nr:MAG: hypothetical protein NPIRA02_39370 [Nitrospirales bacterium]